MLILIIILKIYKLINKNFSYSYCKNNCQIASEEAIILLLVNNNILKQLYIKEKISYAIIQNNNSNTKNISGFLSIIIANIFF